MSTMEMGFGDAVYGVQLKRTTCWLPPTVWKEVFGTEVVALSLKTTPARHANERKKMKLYGT